MQPVGDFWTCPECGEQLGLDVDSCPCQDEPDPNPHYQPDTLAEWRGER